MSEYNLRRIIGVIAVIGMGLLLIAACSGGDEEVENGDGDAGGIDADTDADVDIPSQASVELSHPGHGMFGLSTDVRLVWKLSEPSDTYDVDVAKDSEFSDLVVAERDWSYLDYPLIGLSPQSTYYWRVRTHGDGQQGWSDTRSFEVGDESTRRPVVYQLIVRHFGNTEGDNVVDGTIDENGVGTFSDIDEVALSRLRAMGVTHVYLTGVLQQATLTDWSDIGEDADDPDILKGKAGSFFAVRDYFDVSPDYADDPENRREEFRELVERIHDADMKVLMDLVPNHVARSYGSTVRPEFDLGLEDDQDQFFSPQNHFFYLESGIPLELPTMDSHWQVEGMDGSFAPEDGTPGNVARVTGNNVASHSPPVDSWYETVKLNYGLNFETGEEFYDPRPPTWDFMHEVIRYWVGEFGVDGFRVDFAHFVPDAFWSWVIEETKAEFPDTYFVAEAYENLHGLMEAGFDVVYDDGMYDGVKGIYNETEDKYSLDDYLASIPSDERHRYIRYLENHDERRIASPVGPDTHNSGYGDAEAGRHVAPLVYLYGDGALMLYNGQTLGEEGAEESGFSLDDGRSTIFDYWRVPALADWNNDGRFDGGGLDEWQRELHEYYRRLVHLTQHPLATATGYWGVDYYNRDREEYPEGLYAFARYEDGGGQVMVVVTNWAVEEVEGSVRLPEDLLQQAGLDSQVGVYLVFDEDGENAARLSVERARSDLSEAGFDVGLEQGATRVYLLR